MVKCRQLTQRGTYCRNSANCRLHSPKRFSFGKKRKSPVRKSKSKSPKYVKNSPYTVYHGTIYMIKIVTPMSLDLFAQRQLRDKLYAIIPKKYEPVLRTPGDKRGVTISIQNCTNSSYTNLKTTLKQVFPMYRVM